MLYFLSLVGLLVGYFLCFGGGLGFLFWFALIVNSLPSAFLVSEIKSRSRSAWSTLFRKWIEPILLHIDICDGSQVRNRLEDLVTNLQSSKMTLEEQLNQEVNFIINMWCVTLSFKLNLNAMDEEKIDWEHFSLIIAVIFEYHWYTIRFW